MLEPAFEGEVALVTGGGSGIGRATALAFAERGADVVVSDVDAEGGRETVAAIRETTAEGPDGEGGSADADGDGRPADSDGRGTPAGDGPGGRATFVEADVTEDAEVAALVEEAVERYGGLDCAFNNAGVGGARHPTEGYPGEVWERFLAVNLTGVHRCMRHELPHLLESGGAVVNTASTYGRVGVPRYDGYVAAKHGVLGATKAAALEYADEGVRVNAVCPGGTDTAMVRDALDADERAALAGGHPMGRLADPEEVAAAVVWLCSEAASFVTGHGLAVDGGYLAK